MISLIGSLIKLLIMKTYGKKRKRADDNFGFAKEWRHTHRPRSKADKARKARERQYFQKDGQPG